MDVTTLQWAVTGYSLVGAAVIVTSGFAGRCVRAQAGLPAGPAAVRHLVRAHRPVVLGRCRDRGTDDPGRGRLDNPGLRAEPALRRQQRSGPAAGRVTVGRRGGGRGCSGTPGRRCARRAHRLAGPVLARRGDRHRVHGHHVRDGVRVTRPQPLTSDRLPGIRAHRADPGAGHPGAQQGQRLGLVLGGDHRLPCGRHRRGVRVRRRGATCRRAHARPEAARQPDPRRGNHRDPDRRRNHQWPHVPGQPLLPGPLDPWPLPAAGRPGDPPRHRWARRRRTTRAAAGLEVRRPPGHRHRLPHHCHRVRSRRALSMATGSTAPSSFR